MIGRGKGQKKKRKGGERKERSRRQLFLGPSRLLLLLARAEREEKGQVKLSSENGENGTTGGGEKE